MNDSISEALGQLIEAAKTGARAKGARISKTQQVRQHLDQIEEALLRGVGRAALAEAYGWSLSVFDAALYRARRMRQAGGDRRIRKHNRTGNANQTNPASADVPAPTSCSKLVKPL